MKLKNKISLLIVSAIIISAATISIIYRTALINALLKSHFISEKQNLQTIATSLLANINTQLKISNTSTKVRPASRDLQKFSAKEKPSIRGIEFLAKTPYLIVSDGKSIKKIDFLSVWSNSTIPSYTNISLGNTLEDNKNQKIYFITDGKGILVAHNDIERVKSISDFSSLEAVKTAINSKEESGLIVTHNEKNQKTVAVWLTIYLNPSSTGDGAYMLESNQHKITQAKLILFSFTPYETILIPSKHITRRATLFISIISFLLLWIGIIAAQKISGPLVNLSIAARRVGEGELDFPLQNISPKRDMNASPKDEVQQLEIEFTRMAVSIRNLLKMREDLVNMIIHDLKSPLSAIISSIDFLLTDKENSINNDKQKKFLMIARNSSSNLMRLIEDMLDAAKIEEGKLKPKISYSVNIKKMLEDILKNFEAQRIQEEKLLLLKCSDSITADLDPSLIKRVLTNLLSNAFRHTRRGEGAIEVEATITTSSHSKNNPEYLQITISDNGEGIPKEYQDKIFDKFTTGIRDDSGAKIARSGTGLGLTFSKMAVESHPGGKIFVESEVGKGACFTILIPKHHKEEKSEGEGKGQQP